MSIGFSKNFNLERVLLWKVLQLYERTPTIPRNEIMSQAGIGSLKVAGMQGWLSRLGFRDSREKTITDLGRLLLQHDTHFELHGTMWVIHYQLANDPETEVWHILTNDLVYRRAEFTRQDALRLLVEEKGLRSYGDQHLRSDVTIYFNAFTRDEGLGATNFIREDQGNKGVYIKGKPRGVHPLLVAYVIYSQRARRYPEATMIGIDRLLNEDGNVGKVFSLTEEDLLEVIRELHFDKVVDYSSTADLNHIWFTFKGDPLDLLRRYYEEAS